EADLILAAATDSEGVGAAVMNRLLKAADGKRFDG
ncbi:Sua5 family C-terminal domain-containing protein, partial [Sporosarcina koreensis]